MFPNRKLSSIQCIFGDGFINENLKIGTILKDTILKDVFHLYHSASSVWSKDFNNFLKYFSLSQSYDICKK